MIRLLILLFVACLALAPLIGLVCSLAIGTVVFAGLASRAVSSPLPASAVALSLVSAGCAATASLATLALPAAFPEVAPGLGYNAPLAEARGWSVVTLGLALPLFGLSLRAALLGSLRGRLIWLGVLAYFIYTYLEMAVSPPFTHLYLVYIAALR